MRFYVLEVLSRHVLKRDLSVAEISRKQAEGMVREIRRKRKNNLQIPESIAIKT
ncbi:MAG: hypothetical protein AB2L24_27460 [Mangrovibacterium sp.]